MLDKEHGYRRDKEMENMQYSVLMSVYRKEKPENLRQAMQSMLDQSYSTNDFVLVCDGPLNEELESVISDMQYAMGDVLHVVRLEKNEGLGSALNIGLLHCKNELVARMDSDDISYPMRCEKEIAFMCEHPDVSIVGGWVEEFETEPSCVKWIRNVPETSQEIVCFSQKRNPFNHPSVMYRKSDVIKAGNYENIRYMQDYYLWISMLILGYRGWNLQEPLVKMRADANLFKRRSGKMYREVQVTLFRRMLAARYISYSQFCKSVLVRWGSSIAPNCVRKYLFRMALRKNT